ncbi:hypothetical protein CRUP_007274 [Coryphaenoides rupestris]|nr:hypothetical protein CRUP_007274 [Coryphaenoides rupestris]
MVHPDDIKPCPRCAAYIIKMNDGSCNHMTCAVCGCIGVPIMLAYVYGVVPISLCRSGGCGVSAGNGKGVRIEFDDENEMNVGSGAAATASDMTDSTTVLAGTPHLSRGM